MIYASNDWHDEQKLGRGCNCYIDVLVYAW